MRNTEEVIADIKKLVDTKGYIYSLCLILFEDFYVDLNEIHKVNYKSNLSVKECTLIIGFIIQKKLDFSFPESPETVIFLKEKTYKLMKELQKSFTIPMSAKFQEIISQQNNGGNFKNTREDRVYFFAKDKGMMEPMFYSGDSVYEFQYLEYLDFKYKYDREWLIKNRGFYVDTTRKIVKKIKQIRNEKSQAVVLFDVKDIIEKSTRKSINKLRKKFSSAEIKEAERQRQIVATFYQYCQLFPDPEEMKADIQEGWFEFYRNLVNLFIVTPSDLKDIDQDEVETFFQNFSFVPECNEGYEGPGHFNILNSRPLIKLEGERYFAPISYLIFEAVYETPFYWMCDDKEYLDTLAKHRGDVGEEIAYHFLSQVFGTDNTFRSVIVEGKKGQRHTDIDVLCILGNKALCVQVKSKKLTLTAKRGDFDQLSKDFKGAVQDAYNQGFISREAILNKAARFIDKNGSEILLKDTIDEVYILGLTTENYPTLVHQVYVMLEKESEDPYPLFLSAFDLELLVHYLKDPYDFLYYVRQRIDLTDYFRADEELIYLGYHLQRKLWRMEGYAGAILETDYAAIIDRNYYPHKLGMSHLVNEDDDPVHNRWKDPQFDLLLKEIKSSKHPRSTDVIFHLLDYNNDSRASIAEQLIKIKNISQNEGKLKSFATFTAPDFGLSYIALNNTNLVELQDRVVEYAKTRKYLSKCNAWVGLGSFSASSNLIDYIFYLDEPWHTDVKLEDEYGDILSEMKKTPFTPNTSIKNVGRNDPCPCKSGKKYKRCCGS